MVNELKTVRAALLGDSEAAAQIHRKHHTWVLGALMNRGALMQLTRSEVEECVGDLWSDCFGGRRKRFRHDMSADEKTSSPNSIDKIPAGNGLSADADLVSLLRTSFKKAFARSNREQLLLLCLVYLHGIKQKELADIYGCNESTISRWLDGTRKQIHADTLRGLEALDPATGLDWREIVQLCETINQALRS